MDRRNSKLILWLLLASLPAWATFNTPTQIVKNCTSAQCGTTSGTSFTINIASTGAGHALVVEFYYLTSGVTLSSLSGGGTWVHCTGCASCTTLATCVDFYYVLSSTSGATSITATVSTTGNARGAIFYELPFTGSSVQFDAANTLSSTTSGTTNTGPVLTLSGSNDAIIQGLQASAAISGISSPYTLELYTTNAGRASGYNLNTTSGSAVTWTTGTNITWSMNAIAFKEITPSVCVPSLLLSGAGSC